MSVKRWKFLWIGVLAAVLLLLTIAVAIGEDIITDASGQWTYALDDGEATLIGYEEEPYGDLVIPGKLDGYPVRSIGSMAFADCNGITGVTIHEGVTIIGAEAFARCYSLTYAVIPDSVTEIYEWAFKECLELVDVTLGSNVTDIAEAAFFQCEALTKVTLPDSVTFIGNYAFAHCFSLEGVVIPAGVEFIGQGAFDSFFEDYSDVGPNENVILFVEEGSYAEEYAEDNDLAYSTDGFAKEDKVQVDEQQWTYVLKDGYAMITAAQENIEGDVIIPDELEGFPVTAIGDNIFALCGDLLSVTFPESVQSIGVDPLNHSIPYVKRGSYAHEYMEEYGYDYLFVDGSGQWIYSLEEDGILISGYTQEPIDTLELPKELDGAPVRGIGESAFEECDRLTKVIIPSSVTIIYDYAFSWCNNLVAVVIPQSVIDIGVDAFWDSEGFTLYVTEGSYAEEFAQESDIPYEYAEE